MKEKGSSNLNQARIATLILLSLYVPVMNAQRSTANISGNKVASPPAASDENFDLTSGQVADQQKYSQPLRPQFHYTALQGPLRDATGLVYYQGEYHLFNIFDEWSRKSWVHTYTLGTCC
jgi:hypothetical protein